MKLIERTFYLDKLKDVMGTPDIKVITGVRRSGKSKLLEAFMEYVRQTDKNANIMHVNYSLSEYEPLLEYHKLNEYVEQAYQVGKTNYIFIDEVQMCDGFEKAINNFHATEKYDIYITGSNAFLLSSDLATLFTGRTLEIEVYPFSFAEFMQYYNLSDQYAAFNRYLTEGGMAGSFLYKTPEAKYDYISDVFSTLIVRDIKKKYKIRNMPLMDRLCDFLIDNISNLTSTRSIAAAFTKEQFKTNDRTISAYIKYLCNAFAFYTLRQREQSRRLQNVWKLRIPNMGFLFICFIHRLPIQNLHPVCRYRKSLRQIRKRLGKVWQNISTRRSSSSVQTPPRRCLCFCATDIRCGLAKCWQRQREEQKRQ